MKVIKKKFKKSVRVNLLVAVFALIFFANLAVYNTAKSTAIDRVHGFAWEADDLNLAPLGVPKAGMEWLSFNCADSPPLDSSLCSQSSYGVDIVVDPTDPTIGWFKGYAWSPHLGWAQFGDLSGWPTSSAPDDTNAKVNLITGEVSGWWRFCSPTGSPNTCNGPSYTNWQNGGWDGWVKNHGSWANPVTYNPTDGTFSGYAWGGNNNGSNVVGWIDFSRVTYNNSPTPKVALTASDNPIPTGGNTILTWEGNNYIDKNIPCDATEGSGSWAGVKSWTPNTFDTGPLTTNTTYKIVCYDSGHNPSNVAEVLVKVGVEVVLEASPDRIKFEDGPPYTTTLKWRVFPPNADPLTNCVAQSLFTYNPDGRDQANIPEWDGPTVPSGTPGQKFNVPVPYDPTFYKITCDTASGPVSKTIPVVIDDPLPPSIDFRATKPSCTGTPSVCKTKLTWKAENIIEDTCVATASAPGTTWDTEPSGPPTPPEKNDSGTQSDVIVLGRTTPPPGTKTIYTITCQTPFQPPFDVVVGSISLDEKSSSTGRKYYIEK